MAWNFMIPVDINSGYQTLADYPQCHESQGNLYDPVCNQVIPAGTGTEIAMMSPGGPYHVPDNLTPGAPSIVDTANAMGRMQEEPSLWCRVNKWVGENPGLSLVIVAGAFAAGSEGTKRYRAYKVRKGKR